MQVRHAREQYVRWLRVTKDLSPHTLRAYDGDLAAFERHVGPVSRVGAIDRECVVGFMEAQRAAGLSATSVRRRAAALRGFCRWLMTTRHLRSDPWVGAAVSVGRSRRLPRLVPSSELDRLVLFLRREAGADDDGEGSVDVLARPHQATTLLAVALMVATGVRVHEVVGIRCDDVDLPARCLRIVGKGRRERNVFLTNEWLEGLVSTYIDARGAMAIDHAHLLFNARREPLSPAAMRARLVAAGRNAGLHVRVTPHMLRHTAATQLIEAGVDIRYIQRLLGHASLTTTEIYTHVSDGALRRVVSDADVLGRLSLPR
ncbi:MAG: tyrosine-type recombinase/integrase [Actinomycetota bacterium]|nr:tyrosine-type recombinase/integrase [Actinomycetota bacterium]